jgi:hypothetical protein
MSDFTHESVHPDAFKRLVGATVTGLGARITEDNHVEILLMTDRGRWLIAADESGEPDIYEITEHKPE